MVNFGDDDINRDSVVWARVPTPTSTHQTADGNLAGHTEIDSEISGQKFVCVDGF